MARLKTLNELDHLKQSRFGRPPPRHGLKLLHWFAAECMSFENSLMMAECDPESKEFGFHLFENRPDQNGAKLLPDVKLEYYEVGNLNSPGAEDLPSYVRQDYNGSTDNSNMDRVIVSLDEDLNDNVVFSRVYVTEHSDRSNFNPHATYRISKGLLMIIRSLNLEDFLMRTGYCVVPIYVPVPQEDLVTRIWRQLPSIISAGPSRTESIHVPSVGPSRTESVRVPSAGPSRTESVRIPLAGPSRTESVRVPSAGSSRTKSVRVPSAGPSSSQDALVEVEPPSVPDMTYVTIENDTPSVRMSKRSRCCNCTIL